MSSRYPEPRWCPVCTCRTMEPDAEPQGDWTWRCNICGYTEFEGQNTRSDAQRSWAAHFAFTRRKERNDWIEQYKLKESALHGID